jgi:hypothetical protein
VCHKKKNEELNQLNLYRNTTLHGLYEFFVNSIVLGKYPVRISTRLGFLVISASLPRLNVGIAPWNKQLLPHEVLGSHRVNCDILDMFPSPSISRHNR